MDKQERDRLRALCEAATAGEWSAPKAGNELEHVLDSNGQIVCQALPNRDFEECEANIAFIAASHAAVPAALDALDAMEARLALVESENDAMRRAIQSGDDTVGEHYRAKVAELEAERDAATLTMQDAVRSLQEVRRATAEAIVRRLRTIEESDQDVEWLTDLIEREFLTEKGGMCHGDS